MSKFNVVNVMAIVAPSGFTSNSLRYQQHRGFTAKLPLIFLIFPLPEFCNLHALINMAGREFPGNVLTACIFIGIVGFEAANKAVSNANYLIIFNILNFRRFTQPPFLHLIYFQQHSGSARILGWGVTPFFSVFAPSATESTKVRAA